MVQHDLCEDLVPMKATGAEQLAKRADTQKKKIAELEQVRGCLTGEERESVSMGEGGESAQGKRRSLMLPSMSGTKKSGVASVSFLIMLASSFSSREAC